MDNRYKLKFSWVLYDWANSAFALSVLVAFFPALFKQYWAKDLSLTHSTSLLGGGNTLAGLLISFICPLLGIWATARGGKKIGFSVFMLLGAACTMYLGFIPQNDYLIALAIFLTSRIGYSVSLFYYDSMLVDVTDEKDYDRLSSMGFAFGYLGCGLLFVLHLLMLNQYDFWGFTSKNEALKWVFITTSIWWVIFTLPLLMCFKEDRSKPQLAIRVEIKTALGYIKANKKLWLFLLAFWFYNDGVHAFTFMAVDFGLNIGLSVDKLMIALLITQFIAFPFSFIFHWLGERWGVLTSIQIAICIFGITLCAALFITSNWQFIAAAAMTGSAIGGIQALSRSYFANLIPKEKSVFYFGLYNLIGKFSTVLGPGIVGLVALGTSSLGVEEVKAMRLSIVSLIVLFVAGYYFLDRVKKQITKV